MKDSFPSGTGGALPERSFAEWRQTLKKAITDNDHALTIEALKYMIAHGHDTPGHWSRLIGLLNQYGAEADSTGYLLRWREARPESLAHQLPHAKRAIAGGAADGLKRLWPAFALELPPAMRVTACLNVFRRESAGAIASLFESIDNKTLPPLLQQAARLCAGATAEPAENGAASAAELEIATGLAKRWIDAGDLARGGAALHLLAAFMDERASVPGLNELLQSAFSNGNPALSPPALTLARKNHHVLLRETFSALLAAGRTADALAVLERLHELFSGNSSIFQMALGIADTATREKAFGRLLEEQRGWAEENAEAAAVHGRNLMLCGRLTESRVALTNALHKWPDDARLHGELAETCFWLDDFDAAEKYARRALSGDSNRAIAAALLTRIAIARSSKTLCVKEYRNAQSLGPINFPGLPLHAMMCGGMLAEAFDYYWTDRWLGPLSTVFADKLLDAPSIENAIRNGVKIAGPVMIVGVHGIGDAIKFARLMPEIAKFCEAAAFLCEDRLLPLFQRSFPELKFVARNSSAPVSGLPSGLGEHFDAVTLKMAHRATGVADLKQFLRYFRSSAKSFEASAPALRPDPVLSASWKEKLAEIEGQKLGLFWRSSLAGYTAGHKRSSLLDWVSLLKDANARIVPLQYGIEAHERDLINSYPRLFLPQDLDTKNDFEQLAAVMSALDIVVALPGTTQHLAGALGVRTLMPAHPYDAGWRRNPKTRCDWWAPSVRIVTGRLEEGLKGSMTEAAHIVADWPILARSAN